MEEQDFGQYIRKANSRQIIVPVVFLVFLFLLVQIFSIRNWIFPLRVAQEKQIDEAYENGAEYVYYNAPRLLYTGIDHYSKGKIDGYYYYSLNDGRCRYYLIDSKMRAAQPVLENYGFEARILRDEELSASLDSIMAELLGWTPDGVDSVASDYVLSEIDYDRSHILLLVVFMWASGIMAICHILIAIHNVINPYGALNFGHLGKGENRREAIRRANEEYREKVLFMSQGMYVTDNYFIYHDLDEFEIVPLEDIVWAYKHSSLRWSFGTKHFITYTMRLVTVAKKTYSFPGKTKESCDGLLEIVAGKHPEILTGYSEENKVKMAKQ